MTEAQFNMVLGIISEKSFGKLQGDEFVSTIHEMMKLLDDGDMDDYFGTEGWRHSIGWDL